MTAIVAGFLFIASIALLSALVPPSVNYRQIASKKTELRLLSAEEFKGYVDVLLPVLSPTILIFIFKTTTDNLSKDIKTSHDSLSKDIKASHDSLSMDILVNTSLINKLITYLAKRDNIDHLFIGMDAKEKHGDE